MGNSATVCKMAEGDADIALIGLAVMGQNLILNMNDHGFKVMNFCFDNFVSVDHFEGGGVQQDHQQGGRLLEQ